ncbi:MAG: type II secretion system F family protein [Candidatus Pacebacteria bacterium]|nr:type II secretion system F family protein [Candidatus Paceibacterota bacterium]MDD4875031.1 type II secretion system F family protein [Candidatus Paceibacterota bacterium]
MEAKDENQLASLLRSQGLVLIKASPQGKKGGLKKISEISIGIGGVSLAEKMFFTRNLQVMISAGLSIPRAIDIISCQVKSPAFKKALTNIKDQVAKGQRLSDSLSSHSKIFPSLFQSMIKVGEETGTMEEVLKTLATQMERSYELQSKIKGAMTYPAVIVSAMLLIGAAMLIIVVPQLSSVFESMNIELPMTTQIMIGLGKFLAEKWYIALLIIAGSVIFFMWFSKKPFGKKILDWTALKFPVISPLVKDINSAYTVRNLSSLSAAGVPLPKSLEITSETVSNGYYKKALVDSANRVRKGEKLSEALKDYSGIYPQTVIQMVAVGEETGETSTILEKLADFYEQNVTETTKNMASIIEPIMILILGGGIGFFAVSMMQPLNSIMHGIH